MILSNDNDLSIGFPISDFIDWSGRDLYEQFVFQGKTYLR